MPVGTHSRVSTQRLAFLFATFVFLAHPALATLVVFRGKVVMEDGTPPGRLVGIQRTCQGMDHSLRETNASPKTGDYVVHLDVGDFGGVFSGDMGSFGLLPCVLEAVVDGFASSKIDLTDRRITINPVLPNIVLTKVLAGSLMDARAFNDVPRAATRPWLAAMKAFNAQDWAEAEKTLLAVTASAPNFGAGWAALGTVYDKQNKLAEARPALERAIKLDPKPLPQYIFLGDTLLGLRDWEAAEKISQTLIQADVRHQFLDAYLQNALARVQLKNFDGAHDSINQIEKFDRFHDYPRAEYIRGLIYEAQRDNAAAIEHMRNYVQQHPRARDVAEVNTRIANVGKTETVEVASAFKIVDMRPAPAGEARVPGGIRAFSAMAHLREVPSPADFFLQYCRAVAAGSTANSNPTVEARESIRTFMASVSEMESIGEHKDDRTLIRIAVDTDEHKRSAERILGLMGWKLLPAGDGYTAEPGDTSADGLRQRIPAAFGIDELDLRKAIESNKPVEFEIPSETARLIGGSAWNVVLKGIPEITGGPADVFTRDWRFARVYSGLGAMDADAAGTLVSALTLPDLLVKYSPLVETYGEAISVADKQIRLPGGPKAQSVWARVVGANPQNVAAFLRALFDKDQGRVLAFYADLAHADSDHQQFFTATPARADAFYRWYRDSVRQAVPAPGQTRWQSAILQEIKLDSTGKFQLPGGRQAWGAAATDEDALLRLPSLHPLAGVLQLEQKRGKPMDEASAALLVQHFDEWRTLFPYFERLPGLGVTEFQSLLAFADAASKTSGQRQAVLVGDFHALVELVALGTEAGSLDGTQGAKAFREICDALRSDRPSAMAIAALMHMLGNPADPDEALASGLLRLKDAARDNYEQVKTLQHVPLISSLGDQPDAAKTVTALSGAVYAALLNPQFLLVAEDPRLLVKHNFLPLPAEGVPSNLFADSALLVSNSAPGSNLIGGFGRFREVIRPLDRRTVSGTLALSGAEDPPQDPAPSLDAAPSPPFTHTGATFKVNGRLVEVYATITDSKGRYIDDLKASDFSVIENGSPRQVFAFENHTSSVTVALLFDSTGSMDAALPSLKNAALKLIDELRPEDTVGVYSFNDRVSELQPFTTDKVAAQRAVLRAHAAGTTALYDALLRVNHDLSQRAGKKVIIVFTDGDDNSSMLTSDNAILRAKSLGIPIYTVAEGEALQHRKLIDQLASISKSTGGSSFLIHKLTDISAVFQKMSEDLMHGYLLVFQPPPANDNVWRKIEVVIANGKGKLIRAREGYYPE